MTSTSNQSDQNTMPSSRLAADKATDTVHSRQAPLGLQRLVYTGGHADVLFGFMP